MSPPEEDVAIAVDGSRQTEEREQAIDRLEAANECAKLAEVVRRSDVDDRFRELALTALAHPQCTTTLERITESDDVPGSLREQAGTLLRNTPDDAGAGP